jgi:hypothetical protein
MLFSNLLVALALTVLFPLGLMGMLAAGEWLERRTLAAEEILPRRLRRMDSKPPEAVEAMVLEETAHVVAQYWSATGRPASGAAAPNGAHPAQHRLLRAFVEVASRRGQGLWRGPAEPVGFGGPGSAAG